jgi:hypothetical protein
MKLKIFIPKKVAIYLPLYIAEKRGMFEGYLRDYGIKEVEIVDPDIDQEGDIFAVKRMLAENNKQNNHPIAIAIAIADPTSFLVSTKINNKSEVRVIGALINKPPFWAIDHKENELEAIGDFNDAFDIVIHNDEKYATGSLIGKRIQGRNEDIKLQTADYGQEINKLQELYGEHKRVVAITTDIISIAKAEANDGLKVNFSFAGNKSEFEYITTGILTSKKCCDNYPDILVGIIRIFRRAINDLLMERGTVRLVLNEIINDVLNVHNITKEEHEIIYRLFTNGSFYDRDLIISEELWKNTARIQVEVYPGGFITPKEKQEKAEIIDSFSKYVDNRFAIKANENFGWIRAFFSKHKIKKLNKASLTIVLVAYFLLAVAFPCVNNVFLNYMFDIKEVVYIEITGIILPVFSFVIQKFGIDAKR